LFAKERKTEVNFINNFLEIVVDQVKEKSKIDQEKSDID